MDEIAKRITKARGKELERLNRELDRLIGFESGDDKYDPEADGAWERGNRE